MQKLNKLTLGLFFAISIWISGWTASAQERTRHEDLTVFMQGAETGPDVIFIPGLTSHWTTFEDVCAALEHRYRCHMLQLPGFAGFEPMQNFDNGFMHPLREQVISYISTLPQPVTLVGHSLGGTLSMDIAAARPGLVRQLVLIDSLPFLPVTQNPAATSQQMEPIAARIRDTILAQSQEQFEARIPMSVMGLTRSDVNSQVLLEWGLSTNQASMAHAMYDLQTRDLRSVLSDIEVPTLIFGAWAAYESYGATPASTRAIFEQAYRDLPVKTILMSDEGYHFLMWDDRDWLIGHLTHFLDTGHVMENE